MTKRLTAKNVADAIAKIAIDEDVYNKIIYDMGDAKYSIEERICYRYVGKYEVKESEKQDGARSGLYQTGLITTGLDGAIRGFFRSDVIWTKWLYEHIGTKGIQEGRIGTRAIGIDGVYVFIVTHSDEISRRLRSDIERYVLASIIEDTDIVDEDGTYGRMRDSQYVSNTMRAFADYYKKSGRVIAHSIWGVYTKIGEYKDVVRVLNEYGVQTTVRRNSVIYAFNNIQHMEAHNGRIRYHMLVERRARKMDAVAYDMMQSIARGQKIANILRKSKTTSEQ